MTHFTSRADHLRFGAFVGVVVAATAFGFARPSAGDRPFLVNTSDALGFAALALILLQLVVPAPPRVSSAAFRPTLLVRFHLRFGYLALVAAAAHVLLLFVDDVDRVNLMNPIDAPARARAGLAALVALALLTVAATRRRRGRQSRAWRTLHVVLGVVAAAVAFGHVAGVGGYLGLGVLSGTVLTLVPLSVLLALYFWPERPSPSR